MRIKIIGDNNCARATRHLLRLAGFAVTEFLPVDAVTSGPHAGYAITIDLAPATHTPDARHRSPKSKADFGEHSHLGPESPAHHHASAQEEAPRAHRDASSPAPRGMGFNLSSHPVSETTSAGPAAADPPALENRDRLKHVLLGASIHFDSVDSVLEAAVLRHVTQLAAAPVIVDRPGGVVHSDRELRIVAPNTGDAKADEAAAVAIEFGVLRGLLDLTAPNAHMRSMASAEASADKTGAAQAGSPNEGAKKKWWLFGLVLLVAFCCSGASRARTSAGVANRRAARSGNAVGHAQIVRRSHAAEGRVRTPLLIAAAVPRFAESHRLKPVLLEADPQGQFATGQGFKITDGNNFLVVDPCKAQAKSYASISQTASAQLVAGTASKKIYVCSIHVVVAAATNVAVVEGTGTTCGTGTAGVGGFGGATAATGWNLAANGGIALGNGDSSLGAEVTGGDNLCIFNSGSGQVSGGISYVVQ
jgi:hypothetical protein